MPHALDVDSSAIEIAHQACNQPFGISLAQDTASASSASHLRPALHLYRYLPGLRRCEYVQVASHPVGRPNWLGPAVMLFQELQGSTRSKGQGLPQAPVPLCLGPQPRACNSTTPGPTRSSAPDSRDLTLHLYLHLTCRAARQATSFPNVRSRWWAASQPVWRRTPSDRHRRATKAHMVLCRSPASEDFCADQRPLLGFPSSRWNVVSSSYGFCLVVNHTCSARSSAAALKAVPASSM